MKTLIDTTCPHCGHDISLASIRYDVFSDTPLPDTGYVCTHCWKASKVSMVNKRKERHVSFVPTDEKCAAVWSIVFSDKNRPMNPFIASTTMPIDLDRFMSELTLGTVEHVNEIGELYIAQSLNQGHHSADGSVWLSHGFVEGLDVDEPLFLYPKGFRELSFSEAEELMGQDNPTNHHEENARRFSPDRKATNLSMDNAVVAPANRVLH